MVKISSELNKTVYSLLTELTTGIVYLHHLAIYTHRRVRSFFGGGGGGGCTLSLSGPHVSSP